MLHNGISFSLIFIAIGITLANECPEPFATENSHYEILNDTAFYYCDGGFKFDGGNRESTCTGGSWEKIKFTCKKNCDAPPDIKNAKIHLSREDSVTYKCQSVLEPSLNQSSDLEFDFVLFCKDNEWKVPENPCLKENGSIPQKSIDDFVNGSSMTVKEISTASYENGTFDTTTKNAVFCNGTDADNTTCQLLQEINETKLCIDSFISGTNISCTSNKSELCPEPEDLPGSFKKRDTDGNVIYTCSQGYTQLGNISVSFCQNGTWSETDINCLPNNSEDCAEPKDIPGSYKERDTDGNVTYNCNPGFVQFGNISTSSCENGSWSEIDVYCIPETILNCGPLPLVPFSSIIFYENTATFTCEPDYVLQGDPTTSICENGSWTEIDVTCVSKVAIEMEKKLRQRNRDFREKLEKSKNLICSFDGNEQSCRCNNRSSVIVRTLGQKIAKHNSFSLHAKSLKECEMFCLKNESCLSLEYKESDRICQLSRTASYLVEKMIIMKAENVHYGEKACIDSPLVNQETKHDPVFNFNELSTSALLCGTTSQKEFFCGCLEGKFLFTKQVNKKILMHNMVSFRTNDPLKCFERCQEMDNCLSGEFKPHKKVCHLSKTARYLVDEYIFHNSPNVLYFEKECTPF